MPSTSKTGLLPAIETRSERIRRARRGIILFLTFVIALSILGVGLIATTKNITVWVPFLMWIPAIASILARLILHESPSDISFRLGRYRGLKGLLIALLLPTIVGLLAYGLAWTTGLAHFVPYAKNLGGSAFFQFAILLFSLSTTGTIISALTAIGEEIGWRGYMLTRLVDAEIPRPVLVSGLIWGFWHLPAILGGFYANGPYPLLSAVFFMIMIISFGYIIARLRLESGSIWPAVLLHSAWNSIILGGFDRVTQGRAASLWTGESGIFVALTLVLTALVFSRGQWQMIRILPGRDKNVIQEKIYHP